VGDGPEKERLLKAAVGLNVTFTGFLDNHWDVLREIAASSVFVSFSDREGFNIAALEACQIGLPTYVRRRYFDHKNLHAIERATLKTLIRIICEKPVRNLEIDLRYSWEEIARQVENTLAEVCRPQFQAVMPRL